MLGRCQRAGRLQEASGVRLQQVIVPNWNHQSFVDMAETRFQCHGGEAYDYTVSGNDARQTMMAPTTLHGGLV